MYTLMMDVWPAALAAAAAPKEQAELLPQPAPRSGQQQQAQLGQSAAEGAPVVLQWARACVGQQQQQRYVWCSAVLALIDCVADNEAVRLPQVAAAVPLDVLVSRVLPAAALLDEDLLAGLQDTVQKLLKQQLQQQQQGRFLQAAAADGASGSAGAAGAAEAASGVAAAALPTEGLSTLARLADAAAAAAGLAAKRPAGQKQQWQQQQQQLLGTKPLSPPPQQQLATPSVAVTEAAGGEADAQAGRSEAAGFEVVQALAELASLQGTYPDVQLSALAHVADVHGIWV
jgi:hypothetical protein